MATARPPGGAGGTPTARLGIDLSQFQRAPTIAREAARATEREISNAFKSLRAEQKLAQTQANTTLAAIRAQQAQITATTKAESAQRVAAARAEGAVQAQTARAAAATTIEEQRRITATHRAEIRAREAEERRTRRTPAPGGSGFLGGVVGGIAVNAVIGGVERAGRFALESEATATAYRRQSVAARELAGSQGELNLLLRTYSEATGGAVDKATALSKVTRLVTVGFADTSEELRRIATIARGAAIALGESQDYILSEMQLASANQSKRRLDQIGVSVEEFDARMEELRQTHRGVSNEMLFNITLLDIMEKKFAALANSPEALATGTEKFTAAWHDFGLEFGLTFGDWTNATAEWLSTGFPALINAMRQLRGEAAIPLPGSQGWNAGGGWSGGGSFGGGGGGGGGGFGGPEVGPTFDADQTAALRRREEGYAEIERQAAESRLEATNSYERQRTSTITNYEKAIAREAEDFGRQRANAERKFALSLLDIAQDSARQRAKWEEELARNIAQAQADSAERVAELREDSSKRLAESEEKYAADREKRQREHQKTLREAAANLDAVAVREEQRRYRDEAKEAKDAHDEQKQDIQAQLDERLDDEAKSLAKSIAQSRETNQRRVEEQAENDRLRIEEMKAAFEAQKVEEDAQRAIQLGRRAEDHEAQLTEMATAQAERIQQIKDHAQEERDQFTEESNAFLEEVGIHNQAWLDEQEKINKGVIRRHEELLEAQRRALLNPMGQTPAFPSLANPYQYVPPVPIVPSGGASTSSSRSVTMGDLHLTIIGGADMSRNEFRDAVYDALVELTEDD